MKPIRVLALMEASSVTGPAKNLFQYVQWLRASHQTSSVDLSVVTFERPGMPRGFIERAKQLQIPVYPIQEKGRWDRSVIPQLKTLIQEIRPDVLESHAVKSHFLVRYSGVKQWVRWIAVHHGYTWPDLRMRLYNQLDRWSLRGADRVRTVTHAFEHELRLKGVASDHIEVIHNCIDPQGMHEAITPEKSQALKASLGVQSDQKVVLSVGRLSHEKDHETLLRAMQRVKSAHVVIVGDGPRRNKLNQLTHELGMAQRVTFTGHVETALPYYGIANVVVLSSLSEGSPNALLEAMAAKVPIAATSVGGIVEIVAQGESALLVKPRDAQSIANAVDTILKDPALAARLRTRAYEHILFEHTPEIYLEKLRRSYEGLLNRPVG